jgi:hypothetical protein
MTTVSNLGHALAISLGWSFKDHGKSFEAVYERHHPPRDTDFSTNPLVQIGDSRRPSLRLAAYC